MKPAIHMHAGHGPDRRISGFSLVEMLVVLAIIAISAGMIAGLSGKDRRDGTIRAAAEELAATLRVARSRAMDQAAIVGVSFNIRNGLDSSGRVLNNFDGGHWYRIIGPDQYVGSMRIIGSSSGATGVTRAPASIPQPSFFKVSSGSGGWHENDTVQGFLKMIQNAWIGDRHTLMPHKVRFLALSDQDNGGLPDPTRSGGLGTFVATYPRPWFGTWLAGRLYPWGGYDPVLIDASGRACSGFYFQGDDGAIAGCRNPADRTTTYEPAGQTYGIFAKDAGRPLINGDWLDYVILFYPDGSAAENYPLRARFQSYAKRGTGGSSTGGINKGDLGDMTGCSYYGAFPDWPAGPMTSYADFTNCYAITLAPDAEQDSDAFASPTEAFASIMPAYRVQISRRGLITVAKVMPHAPADKTPSYLPAINWTSVTDLRDNYRHLYRTIAIGSIWQRYGMPVADFLTPSILDGTGGQRWWIAP